jgi:hypothetical protein
MITLWLQVRLELGQYRLQLERLSASHAVKQALRAAMQTTARRGLASAGSAHYSQSTISREAAHGMPMVDEG